MPKLPTPPVPVAPAPPAGPPVQIVRQGDKIILPEGMSYADAHTWITRQEQEEETTFTLQDFIDCFPLDGIVALSRAVQEIYGFTQLAGSTGFWGMQFPPQIIQVPTATGLESAPMGELRPPKWEGGYVEAAFYQTQLRVTGELKRKFEPELKEVLKLTRKMLRDRSIYRGQPVQMDLAWMDDPENFNVIRDAPKFIDLSGVTDLILNRITEFELATSVYMILERSKACATNGIKLKHGALFKGPFGTGKTLTARVIAQKAVANGWSFIYLKNSSQLAHGLSVAKLYSPAVVFAEDIDTVVSDRDEDMNNLLNTLDGVDTKTDPIMVILTTNKADEIDPSFLRAGRIDTVIHFGEPDPEAVVRFIEHFGAGMIKPGENLVPVGEKLAGLVPAFVFEAVSKAKRFAIFRTGKDEIKGDITADDLLQAAESVKAHIAMMQPKRATPEQMLAGAVHALHRYGYTGDGAAAQGILESAGVLPNGRQ